MIRGFFTIALGGTLLALAAVPAQAEKAPPRPAGAARSSAARVVEPRATTPIPDAAPLRTAREETRETAGARGVRPTVSLPHPYREQVLPEGRV